VLYQNIDHLLTDALLHLPSTLSTHLLEDGHHEPLGDRPIFLLLHHFHDSLEESQFNLGAIGLD
jgi:hypothetical protein